jgi:hypothetical protein
MQRPPGIAKKQRAKGQQSEGSGGNRDSHDCEIFETFQKPNHSRPTGASSTRAALPQNQTQLLPRNVFHCVLWHNQSVVKALW